MRQGLVFQMQSCNSTVIKMGSNTLRVDFSLVIDNESGKGRFSFNFNIFGWAWKGPKRVFWWKIEIFVNFFSNLKIRSNVNFLTCTITPIPPCFTLVLRESFKELMLAFLYGETTWSPQRKVWKLRLGATLVEVLELMLQKIKILSNITSCVWLYKKACKYYCCVEVKEGTVHFSKPPTL